MHIALETKNAARCRRLLVITATLIFANLLVLSSALAKELWIAPAKASQNLKVGNWAVANLGRETHFSFRIPDDLLTFTEAAVVLIPPDDGEVTYNLRISQASDGIPHDWFTENLLDNVTPLLSAGVLTEIPVTSAFVAVEIQAGEYVSLNFELPEKGETTRVVGMRFKFVAADEADIVLTGDVTGTTSFTQVEKIQGRPVSAVAPNSGDVLKFDGLTSQWKPAPDAISSDRNTKENFRDEDSEQVLAALAGLPIQSWNYKWSPPSVRHLGPMAQDFRAAFGLGKNETHISPIDLIGVSMLAIQALEKRTDWLQKDNNSLRIKLTALEAANADLNARLEVLGRLIRSQEAVTRVMAVR